MHKIVLLALALGCLVTFVYVMIRPHHVEGELKKVPLEKVMGSRPNLQTAADTPAATPTPSSTSPAPGGPSFQLLNSHQAPRKFSRFADAARECGPNEACSVEADAWQEYQAAKERDRNGEETLALLNFLMRRLENSAYRQAAKKIILDAFPEGSQLHYWYLGDYYHEIHETPLAKATYDEYRKRFSNRPELVNWSSLGNFYYETGELDAALECYQNELALAGRRKGVREDTSRASFDFLEERIAELKKKLGR